MGQIRTRSSDIKKRLAKRREERKREKEELDHTPKDKERGKSEAIAKREVTDDGVDITSWPTRGEASRRSGISRSTIIRLQQTGDLEAVQDDTGAWRFNPDDLDAIAETRTSEASHIMAETVGHVVKVSHDQAQTGLDHAKDMHELHIEGTDRAWTRMESMVDKVMEENDDLRQRVKDLEEERRLNLEYIEKAQTKMHEREKEKEKEKRIEDRIDWAMKTVVGIAGPSIMLKLGVNPSNLTPVSTPGNTIGALLEKKEEESKESKKSDKPVSDEITIERLEELNMNALLLIANIDDTRFKLLCHVATPEEVEALTEVRETVARIRANKKSE